MKERRVLLNRLRSLVVVELSPFSVHLPGGVALSGDTLSGDTLSGDTLSGDKLSGDITATASSTVQKRNQMEVYLTVRYDPYTRNQLANNYTPLIVSCTLSYLEHSKLAITNSRYSRLVVCNIYASTMATEHSRAH